MTIDTLRNWELNGLLTVKRRENGYRVYNDEDIKRLKIISGLRCANYSLSAILRLLKQLDENTNIHIQEVLNTPKKMNILFLLVINCYFLYKMQKLTV